MAYVCRLHRTVDVIMFHGQRSGLLGGISTKWKVGPLTSVAQRLLGWEGRYRQRNEKRGRGSLQPYISTFWDVHLLLVPHAIWR